MVNNYHNDVWKYATIFLVTIIVGLGVGLFLVKDNLKAPSDMVIDMNNPPLGNEQVVADNNDNSFNSNNFIQQNRNNQDLAEFTNKWNYYESILEADNKALNQIIASGKYADTESEVNSVIQSLNTRVQIYSTHLTEAQAFLNQYSHLPITKTLKEDVISQGEELNEYLDELDEKLEEYNKQPRCSSGYVLGQDEKCHLPCGSTNVYCEEGSYCYNNQCVNCPSGTYLATDGKCYSY